MSPEQKQRRARLERLYGRPARGEVTASFRTLIRSLPPVRGRLQLVADDDPAIREAAGQEQAELSVHPNPRRGPKGSRRTPEARARDAAMFPNDQLHPFLTHRAAARPRENIPV